jgi:N-acetylglucosamine-6-phosphate deacetylase
MDDDSVFASIIADGHHVDFPAIRIAKQVMKHRLFLITDAVTETGEGPYRHTLANDKYEASGILSGSNLTMAKAVQNMIKFAAVETGEAICMASTYPAKLMGLSTLGKIEAGCSARMVVFDEQLEVKHML